MPYDTGDRKDVRKAEKAAAVSARERIEFLQHMLGSAPGRAWFHDLLAGCHLFTDPFTGDSLLEAYNKGERNVGLRIFADIIAHCPDQYILMMREASIRSLTNGRRTDDTDRDEHDGGPDSGRDAEGSELYYDPDDPVGFRDKAGNAALV